uniref:Uncharacterized protein n=1 Tax=Arundo donax TaxID=35708 RepID=A0A0A9HDT9_ARUDO
MNLSQLICRGHVYHVFRYLLITIGDEMKHTHKAVK